MEHNFIYLNFQKVNLNIPLNVCMMLITYFRKPQTLVFSLLPSKLNIIHIQNAEVRQNLINRYRLLRLRV